VRLPFLFGFVVACSTSAGGPDYTQLELTATDAAGSETDRFCVTLPVLPGARSERTFHFAGGFDATTRADRDGIEIAWHGAVNAPPVTLLTAERLERDYASSLEVRTAGAGSFVLALTAPCSSEDVSADVP
jgi:hypothetical protein